MSILTFLHSFDLLSCPFWPFCIPFTFHHVHFYLPAFLLPSVMSTWTSLHSFYLLSCPLGPPYIPFTFCHVYFDLPTFLLPSTSRCDHAPTKTHDHTNSQHQPKEFRLFYSNEMYSTQTTDLSARWIFLIINYHRILQIDRLTYFWNHSQGTQTIQNR